MVASCVLSPSSAINTAAKILAKKTLMGNGSSFPALPLPAKFSLKNFEKWELITEFGIL